MTTSYSCSHICGACWAGFRELPWLGWLLQGDLHSLPEASRWVWERSPHGDGRTQEGKWKDTDPVGLRLYGHIATSASFYWSKQVISRNNKSKVGKAPLPPVRHSKGTDAGRREEPGLQSQSPADPDKLNRDVSIENSRASINIKHKKAEVLIHVWNIQKSKENNIANTHVLTFNN